MRDVLSFFWAPVCAIGARGPQGPNAQIAVSVFGASIVPERPRLLVNLWKTNYTEELVAASQTLSITLLSTAQLDLVPVLGLRSGRDGSKLESLPFELDENGNPWFPGGLGRVACEVLDATSLGDSTAFLCAVTERESFPGEPLTMAYARRHLPPDAQQAWNEHNEVERAFSREVMTWLPNSDADR